MIIQHYFKIWDSEFFGCAIGEAVISEFQSGDLNDLLLIFRQHSYDLVYVLSADIQSNESLRKCNVPQVDVKLTFTKHIGDANDDTLNCNIESYIIDDQYDKLIELTLSSGQFSRFKLDKNFKQGDFERLYTTWINRSVNHEIADDVLVYRMKSSILGFITYKILKQKITIGLIAVDAEVKGRGIGNALIKSIESIAAELTKEYVEVSTQKANIHACHFYQACGYNLIKKQPVFHLWLK